MNDKMAIQNETGIKDLIPRKTSVLLSETHQKVNETTGEILDTQTRTVQKLKSHTEFVQIYLENINFILKLNGKSQQVLTAIIKRMSYNNIVVLTPYLRKELKEFLDISEATISRAFQELISKKVLIHINTDEMRKKYETVGDKSYIVNPNIVGKGSFKDLNKLRQNISREYDIDKLELVTEITTNFDYGVADEMKKEEKYRVIEHKRNQKDGEYEEDILIETQNNKDNNEEQSLFPKEELANNFETGENYKEKLEIELVKQKNLELEIKKNELEIQNRLLKEGYTDEALNRMKNQKF